MPRVSLVNPKCEGGPGQGWQGGPGSNRTWMDEPKPAERHQLQSSAQRTPAVPQPRQTSWPHTLSSLPPWKEWHHFALVVAVWSVLQAEAPLQPSLLLLYVCWRLLLMCLLWLGLGGCVYFLKCWFQRQFGAARQQREDESENRNDQFTRTSLSERPDRSIPLALALADSLLLCVLQEPLPDPSVSHIKALLSRLESVSSPLEFADTDRDPAAARKAQLVRGYLQQRTCSLVRLLQVQEDFAASVKDMLEGLDGLWARLELLHTGVTLGKRGSRGDKDLASAREDAQTLSAVMCHYGKRLECCQSHLNDGTQLLQELTWSHTHISNHAGWSCSGGESVWPELLLQANIEQFDKVQESFLSLEQQISTFQAHLEGLGKADREGTAGNTANARTTCSVNPKTTGDGPPEAHTSTCAPAPAPAADAGAPRSPLHFPSTIGRLRLSGKKK